MDDINIAKVEGFRSKPEVNADEDMVRVTLDMPKYVWRNFSLNKSITSDIKSLSKEILEINKANGWNVTTPSNWSDNEYKIPAILALIHSEVSEALEAFRHNDKENFVEELADVIIRILDCTEGLEVDIESAIKKKLEKNKTRGFRHGGKRV